MTKTENVVKSEDVEAVEIKIPTSASEAEAKILDYSGECKKLAGMYAAHMRACGDVDKSMVNKYGVGYLFNQLTEIHACIDGIRNNGMKEVGYCKNLLLDLASVALRLQTALNHIGPDAE